MKKLFSALCILLSVIILLCSCANTPENIDKTQGKESSNFQENIADTENAQSSDATSGKPLLTDDLPIFSGSPFTILNDNKPNFTDEDKNSEPYELYSELDSLGRCGVVSACISPELMPTAERESIGQVKPSGWVTAKYDIVDGKYLYNRCHLIGFQLTGENANVKNLITGTRYMNVDGMLPFENMVADYIKETKNRVLYRVTPIFKDDELVARGVQMEALSVEDDGEGICFNVYVYNNQPGITINYLTGESSLGENTPNQEDTDATSNKTYILNTNSKKFHLETCSGAQKTSEHNKKIFTGNRDELINDGYEPCGICKP